MERTLTLLITSLFTVPLVFYSVLWIITRNSIGGNSDTTVGLALLATVIGIAVSALWVFILYRLPERFLTQPYLRYIQMADIVLCIVWLIVGWRFLDNRPENLKYADKSAVLDVEVKADSSILQGEGIEEVVYIQFVGGEDFTLPHPENVREEGKFKILPWETTIFSVASWHIRIFLHYQPVSFMLNLPKSPKQSIDWSAWMRPSPYQDDAMPEGIMLRYRFRLVPHVS